MISTAFAYPGVPTFVNATNTSGTGTGSLTGTVTSGTGSTGDVILLFAATTRDGSTPAAPTFTTPAGWNLIATTVNDDCRQSSFWRYAPSAAGVTVSVTRSSTAAEPWSLQLVAARFTGVHPTTPIGPTATGNGNETRNTVNPSVTTTTPNNLIVYANASQLASNRTVPGTVTERWDVAAGGPGLATNSISQGGSTKSQATAGASGSLTSSFPGFPAPTGDYAAITIALR